MKQISSSSGVHLCDRGPAAAKASAAGPLRSLALFLLRAHPAPGRLGHAVHIGLLGILLELQNLLLGHHVPRLHGLLKIAHTGQGIIGVIIPVPDKPAAPGDRGDELGIGGVLQVPGVILTQALEPPELITVYDVTGHLTKKGVHVAEALSGIVQGYVVMSAGQNSVKKQRVYIGLEIPGIHLDAEFIPQNKGNGQSIMVIIIGPVILSSKNDLLQADKILIGNRQGHIGNDLDTLSDHFLSSGAPDGFPIILLIGADYTMDHRKSLTLTKQTSIGHQLPGAAYVIIFMFYIDNEITNPIDQDSHRVEKGTTEGREHDQGDSQGNQDNNNYL